MRNIAIKGKEYPCRITMGALLRYKRQTNKDVQDLNDNDMEAAMFFAYCCTVSACKADGVSFEMEFEQFCDCINPEDFANFFTEEVDPQKKTPMSA